MNFQLPKNIAIIGAELALAWSDGTEDYLPLQKLREACPCAACEGEPDVMGNKLQPSKQFRLESFILKKYEYVGGYGIQFFWGDGHSSGIYSLQYLKKIINDIAWRSPMPPPPKIPLKELEALNKKILAAAAEIHPGDWDDSWVSEKRELSNKL